MSELSVKLILCSWDSTMLRTISQLKIFDKVKNYTASALAYLRNNVPNFDEKRRACLNRGRPQTWEEQERAMEDMNAMAAPIHNLMDSSDLESESMSDASSPVDDTMMESCDLESETPSDDSSPVEEFPVELASDDE